MNIVEQELERIAKQHGGVITPDSVVEAAIRKDSPLHAYFEWDDTEAARQYRIEQARGLIRSVRVEIRTDDRVARVVRYVRDPEAKSSDQGYVNASSLASRKKLARIAMQREVGGAVSLFRRALDVAEALNLSGECQDLLDRTLRLKSKI